MKALPFCFRFFWMGDYVKVLLTCVAMGRVISGCVESTVEQSMFQSFFIDSSQFPLESLLKTHQQQNSINIFPKNRSVQVVNNFRQVSWAMIATNAQMINGLYLFLRKHMKQTIILVLLCLVPLSEELFCSVVCGTSCTGNLNNQCGGSCQTDGAWSVSNPTCVAKPTWAYYDSTSDYKSGTLAVTGATYTGTCGDMNFFGFVYPSTTITVTSSAGITSPYYQMRIYVGIIAIDVACWGCGGSSSLWSSSSTFFINFNDPQGTQTSATNPLAYKVRSNNRKGICNIGKYNEYWNRVSKLYSTYNTTNTALSWTINCNETNNATALWGIREFVILIHTCHYACSSCYGPAATQCYSCVQNASITYWQSNNTCNQTCLNRFGYSTVNLCVYCDLHCTACYGSFDNCSACTTSGIWASYLSTTANANYPTCVNPCADGQFGNKTARTCDQCNATCATCLNSANYCTSCANGYYWTGWFCYNPCPTQYFLDPNGTNCTKCSPFCSVCSGAYNVCTVCTLSGQFKAYLYNATNISGDCLRVCPAGYYAETYNGTGPNLCLACNSNCTLCTGNPTPCTQCIAGLYLLNGVCTNSCPNGTIASNATGSGLCLNCDLVCVDLSINMYFPTVVNEQIYVDMTFSQDLNWTSFNWQTFQTITISSQNIQYTLDMFTITYSNLSASAYRIILEPKTYIFLYNATFTVTTEAEPTPIDTSTSAMPFKSTNYLKSSALTWFLIKGPPFNNLELGIMNSFSTLSTKTNNLLAKPYVQQIKKSGVFSLLFSGAQITSCSILSNQIQSQNLYEGVRVWAVFVFFDAPKYEAISDQTKRFISPTVEDQIRNAQQIESFEQQSKILLDDSFSSARRTLFSTNSMYWRFQRTGQTSFFIYDVYIPMFLIFLCWAALAIAHFSKKQRWYVAYAPHIFSAVHKIHEISIMYVTMASIVEFIYFQPTSSDRIISAIICVIFNVYFAIYELYIYYDMINYPLAEIGNKYYDYYVTRYGYFLKNVRFEEYDISQKWTPGHWLRPYNYHLLSYYKKFVMMISLPLFYSVTYAQMTILFVIQLLEIIRFWNTWPFVSKKRNYYRLSLEIVLQLFFLMNLIQINILQTIMSSDSTGLEAVTKIFYGLGWAGFAFCFYFNLSFVFINIYDLCVGLKVSNRSKMDEARKRYYFEKIRDYEKDNEASSKELVGRWVKLGNLNNKSYGELPEINVRIQLYQIRKVNNKFEVSIKKITNLKMKSNAKLRKANHTTAGGKIERTITLSPADNSRFYSIINDVYKLFEGPHVETIRLKTFINIWQRDYEEGQEILLDRNLMFQRVELISYDNDKTTKNLESMLEDFPINEAIIQNAV